MDRNQIDERAKLLAHEINKKETELIETLQEVERLRIFEDFGLTSLFAYCTKRLKLSEDRAYTFIRIARVAVKVPALKKAIDQKEVSITNAKKVSHVITQDNETLWLNKAKTCSARELDVEIAKEKPETRIQDKVRPITESLFELRCALSPKAEKLLSRAMDLLSQKEKKCLTRSETLESVLEEFVTRHDPIQKAERAAHKNKAKAPVSKPVAKTPTRRTPVPKQIQHQVQLATQNQCTHIGSDGARCENRRFLEMHHKQEVSKGGQHMFPNLTLLCASHHHQLHRLGPGNQIARKAASR